LLTEVDKPSLQAPLLDEDVATLASVFLAVHGVTRQGHHSGYSVDLESFKGGVVKDLADVFGHFGALAGTQFVVQREIPVSPPPPVTGSSPTQ